MTNRIEVNLPITASALAEIFKERELKTLINLGRMGIERHFWTVKRSGKAGEKVFIIDNDLKKCWCYYLIGNVSNPSAIEVVFFVNILSDIDGERLKFCRELNGALSILGVR